MDSEDHISGAVGQLSFFEFVHNSGLGNKQVTGSSFVNSSIIIGWDNTTSPWTGLATSTTIAAEDLFLLYYNTTCVCQLQLLLVYHDSNSTDEDGVVTIPINSLLRTAMIPLVIILVTSGRARGRAQHEHMKHRTAWEPDDVLSAFTHSIILGGEKRREFSLCYKQYNWYNSRYPTERPGPVVSPHASIVPMGATSCWHCIQLLNDFFRRMERAGCIFTVLYRAGLRFMENILGLLLLCLLAGICNLVKLSGAGFIGAVSTPTGLVYQTNELATVGIDSDSFSWAHKAEPMAKEMIGSAEATDHEANVGGAMVMHKLLVRKSVAYWELVGSRTLIFGWMPMEFVMLIFSQ